MVNDVRVVHKGYLRHVDRQGNTTKKRYVVFGQYKNPEGGRQDTYFLRIHDSDKEKILIKEMRVCKDNFCGLDSGVVNTTKRRLLWLFQRQDLYLAIVTKNDTVTLQTNEKRCMEMWKEKLKRELCGGKDISWVLRVSPGQRLSEDKITVHLTAFSIALTTISPPQCLDRYAVYEYEKCVARHEQLELHFNHLGKPTVYKFNTTRNHQIAKEFSQQLNHLKSGGPVARHVPAEHCSSPGHTYPRRGNHQVPSRPPPPLPPLSSTIRPAVSIEDLLDGPFVPDTAFNIHPAAAYSYTDSSLLDRRVNPLTVGVRPDHTGSSTSSYSDNSSTAGSDHPDPNVRLSTTYLDLLGEKINDLNDLARNYINVFDIENAPNMSTNPPGQEASPGPLRSSSSTGDLTKNAGDDYWSARHIAFTLDYALKKKEPPHPDTLGLPSKVRTELCVRLYSAHEGVKDWQNLAEEIGLTAEAITVIQGFHREHNVETAAELVLRHWQYSYNKHGAGSKECPIACDRKSLIHLLRYELEREDLVSMLESAGRKV